MSDDKRLERIEDKVDNINQHIGDINQTLAGQAISLETHIRRTNALQEIVVDVRRKVTLAEGALKLIGFLAIIAGIAESIRVIVGK